MATRTEYNDIQANKVDFFVVFLRKSNFEVLHKICFNWKFFLFMYA